ncbi:GNAT family N-acetyltransferase [Caulobacter sp.]|uniref:GNAT family N-acetyltransferase n=1 Tax=Caulobacter sp. TaxID=78 RepID=UPI002B463A44|nr:GNAT family N-acetyltransferase [Caulobacter sp.]HJV41342.1 GNAT family N-acetyltransferase [Caulobacter sp.]
MANFPSSIERSLGAADGALAPPASWPERGLGLRHAAPADEPFLRDLYFDFRSEELAPTGWPPPQKRAFTDSQFDLQDRYFRASFPSADFLIVQHRQRPIGRLYIDRAVDGFLVMDIGLVSGARGRGLGRELLEHVQGEAKRAGTPKVWLHVLEANPRAEALYRRLGFRRVALEGVHWRMEWSTSRSYT